MDRHLPEFSGGKSPIESCTCNNGNGGPDGPSKGCNMGLRGGVDGKGDGQSCLWWSQACSIGCDKCATETAGIHPLTGNPPQAGKIGFRKRYCESTFQATLPKHAWTLNIDAVEGSEEDSYRFNPWRAPGHAPVVDPCGQAGGEHGFQTLGGDSVYFNTTLASKGMLGSKLPPTPLRERTRWVAGTSVEVQWGVRYNHGAQTPLHPPHLTHLTPYLDVPHPSLCADKPTGGGYSYRLCPANEPLTEACFQRTPLKFDRSKQALKWNNGSLTYPMGAQAVFVDGNVTWPRGSEWARNPIPRIWDSKAGLHDATSCPGPTTRAAGSPPGCLAFTPPCPWDTYTTDGLLPCTPPPDGNPLHKCDGDGMGQCSSDWVVGVISDHVHIPNDLPGGEYVLSWRWDCEETAQVGA